MGDKCSNSRHASNVAIHLKEAFPSYVAKKTGLSLLKTALAFSPSSKWNASDLDCHLLILERASLSLLCEGWECLLAQPLS